jgi:hypothetical protein
LRAESAGYRSRTLSPFLNHAALVDTITNLGDTDLLDWTSFERIEKLLGRVELTFRLERAGTSR